MVNAEPPKSPEPSKEMQHRTVQNGTVQTLQARASTPYVSPIKATTLPFLIQTAKSDPEIKRDKVFLYPGPQDFKNVKKGTQILLSEIGLAEYGMERQVEVLGIELTAGEERAVATLKILLDRSDHKGDLRKDLTSKDRRVLKTSFSWPEYFEAYGIKKRGKHYRGTDIERAKNDLVRLATIARRVVYKCKRYDERRGCDVYDMLICKGNPIQLVEAHEGLDTAKASMVEAGEPLKTYHHRVAVRFHPVLSEGILSYFMLSPFHIRREIMALTGVKRVGLVPARFVSYLSTLSITPVAISEERLLQLLRLDGPAGHRKKTRTRKLLQEAYEIARKLEYLLDYRLDEYGLIRFTLNPERCRRVRNKFLFEGAQEGNELGTCKLE